MQYQYETFSMDMMEYLDKVIVDPFEDTDYKEDWAAQSSMLMNQLTDIDSNIESKGEAIIEQSSNAFDKDDDSEGKITIRTRRLPQLPHLPCQGNANRRLRMQTKLQDVGVWFPFNFKTCLCLFYFINVHLTISDYKLYMYRQMARLWIKIRVWFRQRKNLGSVELRQC